MAAPYTTMADLYGRFLALCHILPSTINNIDIYNLSYYLFINLSTHTHILSSYQFVYTRTRKNSKVNATNSLFLESSSARKLTRVGADLKESRLKEHLRR
jgi:hypothetical protein